VVVFSSRRGWGRWEELVEGPVVEEDWKMEKLQTYWSRGGVELGEFRRGRSRGRRTCRGCRRRFAQKRFSASARVSRSRKPRVKRVWPPLFSAGRREAFEFAVVVVVVEDVGEGVNDGWRWRFLPPPLMGWKGTDLEMRSKTSTMRMEWGATMARPDSEMMSGTGCRRSRRRT